MIRNSRGVYFSDVKFWKYDMCENFDQSKADKKKLNSMFT